MPLLVISLDGAEWRDFEIIAEKLGLDGSFSAVLGIEGTFPTDTYPSHATLLTGVWPEKHGIISNRKKDSSCWNRDYSLIKSPTILDYAKDKGLSVASISWPMSLGVGINYIFPEIWPPEDRALQLKMYKEYSRGIFDFLEDNIDRLDSFCGKELDRFSSSLSKWILEQKHPDMILLHLSALDSSKHNHGNRTEDNEAAYCFLKDMLSPVLDKAYGYDLFFVSDHSLIPCTIDFSLSAALKEFDQECIIQIQASGGFAYVYASDNEKALDCLQMVIRKYPSALGEIVDSSEAYSRWRIKGDFSFIVEAGSEVYLSEKESVFSPIEEGTFSRCCHGYFPKKGPKPFLAFYSDRANGNVYKSASLVDVAPTIMNILGYCFPSDGNILEL